MRFRQGGEAACQGAQRVDPAGIGAPTNCNHMGHVGKRKVPDPRIFKRDHTDYTVMSYFGDGELLGEADKLAIEMIYGA